MDKLVIIGLGAALFGALVAFLSIIGALFGAMGGFFVGFVFDETSTKVLAELGLSHLAMWEIGAALGFVGAFFRSSSSSSSSS